MLAITDRVGLNKNRNEKCGNSLNCSFSSNNSFYEKLNIETKKDIIFLIKSGYDKKMIIKLYIFLKPSNVNEAIHYLTKENGLYQHIFYSSTKNKDLCEICRETKDMHLNSIDYSFSSISFNNNISFKNEKIDVRIKPFQKKYVCKICEEEISEKEKNNECKLCYNYFCNDCLYSYIKETIKKGKKAIKCPESDCDCILTKEIIYKILSFNNSNDIEVNNLKILLEKNKTKEIVLSNPDLMFCPIANCEGYCNKKSNSKFNICNMGHKFCSTCGELYHKDGKCKDEEKVDELFEQFYKKYKLKKCPYCQIVTNKNGGCNHITCFYCGQNWCWLCIELFGATEEHYGNIGSKCYNKMYPNNENDNLVICSNCENETDNYQRFYGCHHIICNNCFEKYLFENNFKLLFPKKVIIICMITDCNNSRTYEKNSLNRFIKESKNKSLMQKYKNQILLNEYFIVPFIYYEYQKYIELFINLIEFIAHNCCRSVKDCWSYCEKFIIFKILITFLFLLFMIIYVIAFPIFPHFVIKKLYYLKLIKELKSKNNNKILLILIILSEEILFLITIFSLMIIHYLYTILFLLIFGLSRLLKLCDISLFKN